jgi:hypothetical protein
MMYLCLQNAWPDKDPDKEMLVCLSVTALTDSAPFIPVCSGEQNHGRAFRKYIKALIADHSKVKTAVEEKISFFVNEVCDEFDGDVARDVAEKFGLIGTAARSCPRAARHRADRWQGFYDTRQH